MREKTAKGEVMYKAMEEGKNRRRERGERRDSAKEITRFKNSWMCSRHRIRNTAMYTVFQKKTGLFVIASYLCFDSYELHENFQKYIGGVACCEYGINVCDSLTILC